MRKIMTLALCAGVALLAACNGTVDDDHTSSTAFDPDRETVVERAANAREEGEREAAEQNARADALMEEFEGRRASTTTTSPLAAGASRTVMGQDEFTRYCHEDEVLGFVSGNADGVECIQREGAQLTDENGNNPS
jgi:hypothetical protein